MNKIEFLTLTEKISDGTATDEEIRLYNAYYNSFQKTSGAWVEELLGNQEEIDTELSAHIRAAVRQPHSIRKVIWPRIVAAASIILCLSIGGYFLLRKPSAQQTVRVSKNDIAPGGNKAILTLAGGQKIVLTGAKNGLLANQGNTRINKTADGQLVYDASKSESGTTIYNTMTTPRGGQYHLTLADGTNVWLNAASSIKYPTAFNGDERLVEITGEAYFEVAHNAAKPFKVSSGGQTVEVLGTHFNINAYADEPAIRTTLLEGSVKLTINKQKAILKPGQQAFISGGNNDLIKIKAVDVNEVMAWKNGYFIFNDENIESIMRKISRWYDIDVTYQGDMTGKEFVGSVSRFKNASEVLRKLEATGIIHFKMDGRRLQVMP
ncbi:FecR family protein [Mucilaginibacter pineti]|uniref:FecR family protein n=1 Tax=Mucilaginibacter pineti TaxID=1391627 RepID=A0A1G7CLF8_9SPHI|nr:FecR family protein [Mucilaginibacter pineti]SDE40244.1 FecR family protein [Mucilaginibacter pineti]